MRRVRRWRTLRISVVIATAAILANAALYFAYRWTSPQRVSVQPPDAEDETALEGEGAAARAARLAGLEALERGQYARAIERFQAAGRAPNPSPDLSRLLIVAQRLRDQEASRREPPKKPSPPNPVATPQEKDAPPPAAPRRPKRNRRPALILVTTEPAGLTVKVDGEVRDRSPARLKVSPGAHTVAVLQGDRRLIRRRISVAAGEATHLAVDLTDALRSGSGPLRPEGFESARKGSTTPFVPAARRESAPEDVNAAGEARPAPRAESSPTAANDGIVKIPPAVLSRVVDRQGRRIRACYEAQLRRQLGMAGGLAEGRVVIRLVVSPDGIVREGRVRNSTLENARVDECIEDVIRELKFPPLERTAEATFVMRFGPEE